MMETVSTIDQYELEYDGEHFKIFVPDYWVKIYRGQKREPLYHDYRLMLDILKKVDKSKYVLDIGANHGLFAIPAAKMGYKVFGFEPVAVNIETLTLAKEANSLHDFDMFHLALSDKNGEVDIYVPECPDNASFSKEAAVSNMRGKEYNIEKVQSARFDDWICENHKFIDVGFIKIDVQGSEFDVLSGMCDFLNSASDITLIVEFEDHTIKMGHTFQELDNLILSYGFKFIGMLSQNDKIFYK